ncbi:hypothetical protein ACQ4PT_036698 [Festuca glaucescens]
MASSETGSSSGVATGKEPEINDLLQHLDLCDDEQDEVVIGAEAAKEFQLAARWLAIAKVHTTRNFSADALFGKMKAIWNLSRDPICREAGENLFVFQMHCLGDWKKVVHQGPWTFRGWAVLIEDYDGKEDPEEISFGGLYVWAQIHGIPELYRKNSVVDDLARRIGKTKEVQMSPKLFYEGNYVRIRVMIDVHSSLKHVVKLTVEGGGKKWLFIKYEKVPFFCKHCGLIGHSHEECGDGVWSAKDLQYGDFMLATRRANPPPPEPRYFPSRGRGGWSGRGMSGSHPRKRSSAEAALDGDEEALKDSATSPLKTTPMEESDEGRDMAGTKKQLDFDMEDPNRPTDAGLPTTSVEEVPPPPPSYTDPRDRSKQRKTNTTNDLATSAASDEDDRRA